MSIDPKDLSALLKVLRSHGVHKATIGDVTVELSPFIEPAPRRSRKGKKTAEEEPMREMGVEDLEKMRFAHTEGYDD